jgi:hypothetical protein
MYFGEYLIKENTKWEMFLYFTKSNGKGSRPQTLLIKELEVQKSVYNNILRN